MRPQRLAAEAGGSLVLAATVVGSGIMAERLAAGNAALALGANTLATVATLLVIIRVLGPVSGAHFNPAVSAVQVLWRKLTVEEALAYVVAQIAGACSGVLLANTLFSLPVVELSQHVRTGPTLWLSEFIATFGLIAVIGGSGSREVHWTVAAWIGAAYWFTPSTSFANPAITIARCLSDSFAGIRPADVAPFAAAQLAGAACAAAFSPWLFRTTAAGLPDS